MTCLSSDLTRSLLFSHQPLFFPPFFLYLVLMLSADIKDFSQKYEISTENFTKPTLYCSLNAQCLL